MSLNNVLWIMLFFTLGVLGRLWIHLPNLTPMGAILIVSSFHFFKKDSKWAYGLPFLILLMTDSVLGFYVVMPFVYGAYFLNIVTVKLFQKYLNQSKDFIVLSLVNALVFYVVTNMGEWIMSPAYSKDLSGFTECMTLALPFFRNSLMGDLVYTSVLSFVYLRYATRVNHLENMLKKTLF